MMKAVIAGMVVALVGAAAQAQQIDFGDDSSQWARDGECDDRRFYGPGMASGLDRDDMGRDASDCRIGFEAGRLALWNFEAAKAATQCSTLDFGRDTSEWVGDGQCDDYRFDGPGADFVLMRDDIGQDASDCIRLCALGQIALREY